MNNDVLSQIFDTWLKAGNYRPGTAAQTLTQFTQILKAFQRNEPLPEYVRGAARRTLAWLDTDKGLAPELREYLVAQKVKPTTKTLRAKPKRRVLESRSFDADDWDRLQAELSASDDVRDRVIECMCVTGIRVGDALRIPTVEITKALALTETGQHALAMERKGGTFVELALGVLEPWQRLHRVLVAAQAPTVAALLSPTHPSPLAGDGPYMQIDRRLKHWQRELGLSGRIHTHKIRRTVAIKLYDLTKDVVLVQQGLNNGAQATMKYLDESRASTVADVQRKIRPGAST